MIEVNNISKSFDKSEVLNQINTVFHRGKTNLIIGQSGSGKTVLLKCLLGLYHVDSGEIIYDGLSSKNMNSDEKLEISRQMGMVFQGSALFDSMNVLENVRFPLDMLTKINESEKNSRAMKFIERVNLKDAVNKIKKLIILVEAVANFSTFDISMFYVFKIYLVFKFEKLFIYYLLIKTKYEVHIGRRCSPRICSCWRRCWR